MRSALVRIETDHSVIERPESGSVCFDSHLYQPTTTLITVGFKLRQSGSRVGVRRVFVRSDGSTRLSVVVAKKAIISGASFFRAGPTRTA